MEGGGGETRNPAYAPLARTDATFSGNVQRNLREETSSGPAAVPRSKGLIEGLCYVGDHPPDEAAAVFSPPMSPKTANADMGADTKPGLARSGKGLRKRRSSMQRLLQAASRGRFGRGMQRRKAKDMLSSALHRMRATHTHREAEQSSSDEDTEVESAWVAPNVISKPAEAVITAAGARLAQVSQRLASEVAFSAPGSGLALARRLQLASAENAQEALALAAEREHLHRSKRANRPLSKKYWDPRHDDDSDAADCSPSRPHSQDMRAAWKSERMKTTPPLSSKAEALYAVAGGPEFFFAEMLRHASPALCADRDVVIAACSVDAWCVRRRPARAVFSADLAPPCHGISSCLRSRTLILLPHRPAPSPSCLPPLRILRAPCSQRTSLARSPAKVLALGIAGAPRRRGSRSRCGEPARRRARVRLRCAQGDEDSCVGGGGKLPRSPLCNCAGAHV